MVSTVKGLGKKMAERIVLELREKVSAAALPSAGAVQDMPAEKVTDREGDAIVGLMSLGYTRNESLRAVRRAVEGGAASVEEIVMSALKNM